MRRLHQLSALAFTLIIWLCAASSDSKVYGQFEIPGLDGALEGAASVPKGEVDFTATYQLADDGSGKGIVEIKAEVGEASYVYSTEQQAPPKATQFKLDASVTGSFTGKPVANQPPKKTTLEVYPGVSIEKVMGTASWNIPIQLTGEAINKHPDLKIDVSGQICTEDGNCALVRQTIVAKYSGDAKSNEKGLSLPTKLATGENKPEMGNVAGQESKGRDIKLPDGLQLPTVLGTKSSENKNAPAVASISDHAITPPATSKITPPSELVPFRNPVAHGEWRVWVEPKSVPPGGTAKIRFSAKPDEHYHVYPYKTGEGGDTGSSTLIVFTETGGLFPKSIEVDSELLVETVQGLTSTYYPEAVTWTMEIPVPEGTKPGPYKLKGVVGYQTCTSNNCDRPAGMGFEALVSVGEEEAGATPVVLSEAAWADALKLVKSGAYVVGGKVSEMKSFADVTSTVETPAVAAGNQPLLAILALAFLGGFVLNFMPCVFPVIGLKVMSFINQSDGSRGRVFALNVWYVLGMMTVFWSLAAFAVVVRIRTEGNFAWGQQFSNEAFTISLICLVFAMALSFLGVWELPIPGFAAGRTASGLQQREGLAGAYFKGVFTTLLATPCSGPGLGAVFAYTAATPIQNTPLAFTAIGLGMGFPYILLGFYPGLAKKLPQPGVWMETFKQVLGFVLLFVVAWLFMSVGDNFTRQTFVLLMSVWLGCWLAGRVAIYEPFARRARAWVMGSAVVAATAFLAFREREELLPWQPYTEARLMELQAQGKTIMVDFTANWCWNCKVNSEVALNRQEVADVVEELDAVTLLADWSDESPDIEKKLKELGSNSIPLLAIYPAGKPNQPIILRDLLSSKQVVAALKEAGASKSGGKIGITNVSDRR